MNKPSSLFGAILVWPIVALFLSALAHAQSNGKSSSGPVLDVVTAHASALTLFAQGDIVNAQKTLLSSNVNQGSSPEADFESGQHLASLALSFHTRRDQTHAVQAANLALPLLTQAAAKLAQVNKNTSAARAYETVANLYATVLADDAAALSAYKQALSLAPQSPRASQAVAKHDQAESELTKKYGEGGH